MPDRKLTKRLVESATTADRDVILLDSEVRGFGCKITPARRRVYFLYYRTASGQRRRPTIGYHGAITVDQARAIARQWLASVYRGGTDLTATGTAVVGHPRIIYPPGLLAA